MQRSVILERVLTPDGEELVLHRRGEVYTLRIGGWELMSSRAPGSEEELARRALELLGGRRDPRVLVGGLGLGFTLRAVLDALPPGRGHVVVAEVFSAVVAWNRGPLAHLAKDPMADPRVEVAEEDVASVVDRFPGRFDAVLLDTDNGPETLTLASNRRLYQRAGLQALRDALTPGGVLAVWCADPEPQLLERLRRAGFEARSETVRARGRKGLRHTLYLARRTD